MTTLNKYENQAVYFALSKLIDAREMEQWEFNFISDLRDKFNGERKPKEKDLTFANNLTELMNINKIKAKEIIEATGIKQSLYSKIKNGAIKPNHEIKKKITDFFDAKLGNTKI